MKANTHTKQVDVPPVSINSNAPSFPCTLLVLNLPKIPRAKEDKLKGVVGKVFSKMGAVSALFPVSMPFGSDDKSLGFAVVTMEKVAEAKNAQAKVSG